MGSFYTVCFVAKAENQSTFMDVCNEMMKSLVTTKKGFSFHYPIDTVGRKWKTVKHIPADFYDMFEKCFQTRTAYFELDYLQDKVLVEIETFAQDSIGLHFSIPEKETNLDELEKTLISFIFKNMDPVFCYAFCDNEAYIEQTADDTLVSPTYSITVINGKTPIIRFNEWKIDGYTKRANNRA